MTKFFKRAALVASLGTCAIVAHAEPPTSVGDLASSVDFTAVGSAMLVVFAAALALAVTVKGAEWVYRKVKSA